MSPDETYRETVLDICADWGRDIAVSEVDMWLIIEPAAAEAEDPRELARWFYRRELFDRTARLLTAAGRYRRRRAAEHIAAAA